MSPKILKTTRLRDRLLYQLQPVTMTVKQAGVVYETIAYLTDRIKELEDEANTHE